MAAASFRRRRDRRSWASAILSAEALLYAWTSRSISSNRVQKNCHETPRSVFSPRLSSIFRASAYWPARQAEIAGQYVRKGRQLYVEGRLQTRDWVDPQGVKHYKTEIVCTRFQLLGRRDDVPAEDYAGAPSQPAGSTSGGGLDEYDIGDLGPPLDMDNNPLTPGD